MTEMEQWLYDDAVILDLSTEEIIQTLLDEGHSLSEAIELVERTQNIKVEF